MVLRDKGRIVLAADGMERVKETRRVGGHCAAVSLGSLRSWIYLPASASAWMKPAMGRASGPS